MGFIHNKLDIKLLVLYLLSRAVGPIDSPTLTDLALCDSGVDYFNLAEATMELVQSGHVLQEDGMYSITDKGRRNCADAESSLSPVIRKKCDQQLIPLNGRLRRHQQVRAYVEEGEGNQFVLHLDLDDDSGNLLSVNLTAASREQSEQMAQNFRLHPEEVYHGILNCLLSKERTHD